MRARKRKCTRKTPTVKQLLFFEGVWLQVSQGHTEIDTGLRGNDIQGGLLAIKPAKETWNA